MGYTTPVKSTIATATTVGVATSCRITGLAVFGGAGNGLIVLRDGGATGTVKDSYQVSAGNVFYVRFAGQAIKYASNVYVSIPSGSALTIHYDPAQG